MSTGNSSWRSRRRALPAFALALTLLAAITARPATGAESTEFELAPAGEELLAADGTAPAAPALAAGNCLVIFRHNQRLSVADLGQITLLAPDGRELPLFAEPLFVEFGRIADVRLAFVLPETEAAIGSGPFTLKWGPEIRGQVSKAVKISADPARRELYRTLRPKPGTGPADANIARLEVIADSTAEYHFLWYLLPMSMVFALLLVRKLMGRGEADSTAS